MSISIKHDGLETQLDELSIRLDARSHEFAELGYFSSTATNSGHHASTFEVLSERLFELVRELDGKTLKCVTQNPDRTGKA